MGKFLLFLIIFLIAFSGSAQEDKLYFSEAISTHLAKYKEKAKLAYEEQDFERADFLFDSLVNHCLKGSFMDNFKLKALNRKDIQLEDFSKPVFLVTYATWLTPSEGEIPALNKLAEEYEGDVDFVVLFWDSRRAAKKYAKKYGKNINIMYVDETNNESGSVTRTLKHSLGLPTNFLLSADKRILDIRRSISHPYGISFQNSFDLNYNSISKGLSLLINSENGSLEPERAVTSVSPK